MRSVIPRPIAIPRAVISLAVTLLGVGHAFAQPSIHGTEASPAVVLLAPREVSASWAEALRVEILPGGATVRVREPPGGATVVLRDVNARRAALAEGAPAAAWVDETTEGWVLRVVGIADSPVRVTRLARDTDARTLALILVSLLDETLGEVPFHVGGTPPTDSLEGPSVGGGVPREDASQGEQERS